MKNEDQDQNILQSTTNLLQNDEESFEEKNE
jgi:hypothetical protein